MNDSEEARSRRISEYLSASVATPEHAVTSFDVKCDGRTLGAYQRLIEAALEAPVSWKFLRQFRPRQTHNEVTVEVFEGIFSADTGALLGVTASRPSTTHWIVDGDLEIPARAAADDLDRARVIAEAIRERGGAVGSPADHLRHRLRCDKCGDSLTVTKAVFDPVAHWLLAAGVESVGLDQLHDLLEKRQPR